MKAVDVLIIGAGPAGLSAADVLGELGAEVLVVDEYPHPGGRLLGQFYQYRGRWWIGREVADQLVEAVGRWPHVELVLGRSVASLERLGTIWQAGFSEQTELVSARTVVIATGATEIPVPIANWTMPGVMTVGAGQVLANVYHVAPGRRGIIVGLGALAFAVAEELHHAEVEVAGIVMPAPMPATRMLGTIPEQWAGLLALSRLVPAYLKPVMPLIQGDAWRRRLMAWAPKGGVPAVGTRIRPNVAALAVEGESRVEAIRLQRLDEGGRLRGTTWTEAVDFVLLSGGLRPLADLFHNVGVVMHESLGGLFDVPIFGPTGETTRPGLFAAGNALGVEGAPIALAQGRLVGVGVGRFLSDNPTAYADVERAAQWELSAARANAPLIFHPGRESVHRIIADEWERRQREGASHEV